MNKLFIYTAALMLAGCTTVSPVTRRADGTYQVRAGNWGGWRTNDQMLEDAAASADAFCAKSGQRAEVLAEHGSRWEAAAALMFRCVPR